MSEIERYHPKIRANSRADFKMASSPAGSWVMLSDHEAKIKELEQENQKLYDVMTAENKKTEDCLKELESFLNDCDEDQILTDGIAWRHAFRKWRAEK